MKAIVIGAGIGGLSAAIAMRQAGWDVALFEQADRIAPMGAAISLWPNAVAALDRLGRGDALRAVAQPLDGVALSTRNGRDIGRFNVSDIVPGSTAYLPTRTELQALLVDGLGDIPLHLGEQLVGYHAGTHLVSADFASGRHEEGDLLIAADGLRSIIALRLTGMAPVHAGYGGVLALSDPVEEWPANGAGTEFWGHRERVGLFDLKDRRKYWFYMKNDQSPDDPAALTRDWVLNRMRGWPDAISAAVAQTPEDRLIPFSVHAKARPRSIAQGRILLVGDAAHAMEPNMGQGACQAIEDAAALGSIARATTPDRIAEVYSRVRLTRARQFVARSREGSLIPHRLPLMLQPLAQGVMRTLFPTFGHARLREMYQLPDYAALV